MANTPQSLTPCCCGDISSFTFTFGPNSCKISFIVVRSMDEYRESNTITSPLEHPIVEATIQWLPLEWMTCNAPVEGSGAFSFESSRVDWSPNSLSNCFFRMSWAKLIWLSVSCSPEVIIFRSASVNLICPSESQIVEQSIRWLLLITASSTEITSGSSFIFLFGCWISVVSASGSSFIFCLAAGSPWSLHWGLYWYCFWRSRVSSLWPRHLAVL